MPAYSNATPPLSLFPGDVGFSFNAEAFPSNGTAGAQFAIPEPAGLADQTHSVRWQTIFGTAPSAISIVLQGAAADVDAEYFTIDTSTATAGGSANGHRSSRALPAHQSGLVHGWVVLDGEAAAVTGRDS